MDRMGGRLQGDDGHAERGDGSAVGKIGKTDKEVLDCTEVKLAMTDEAGGLDVICEEECLKLSKELYRALHLATEDEAKLLVKRVWRGS